VTYSDALAYLDTLAQFGIKLELSRMESLCELADHPERQFPSVLVGGSAGKGSTCAMLTSILQAAGLKVGSSPKPHLFSHCERAQINGRPIPTERFAELMAQIVPLVDQLPKDDPPTVFEVMTLLSFLHFAAEKVDRDVVEVGLGGRFDATNVLTPDVVIITSIGLDHTDRLGDTVEKIAFEKAGIIKPGCFVLCGAEGSAERVITAVAKERGVSGMLRLGTSLQVELIETSARGTTFAVGVPGGSFQRAHISLVGEHQARNGALALAAAWVALMPKHPTITGAAIAEGLKAASIPLRLQVVREEPLVILDAAHSLDRARALAKTLQDVYFAEKPQGPVVFVLGCSQGHAPSEVVGILASLADQVVATKSRHPAAIPASDIASACGEVPSEVIEPVSVAVDCAVKFGGTNGAVVVTGSLFVAAEALGHLKGQASCASKKYAFTSTPFNSNASRRRPTSPSAGDGFSRDRPPQ
jgi:dihydrofolate synthase/folylpolyglutamate synthase